LGLADIIQAGLTGQKLEGLTAPTPQVGFGAGLIEAGEFAREQIRRQLLLPEMIPGPQRAAEPTAVPREVSGEGLLSARTAGSIIPFLLAPRAAAAQTFGQRGLLGAAETLLSIRPENAVEAAALGVAGFAGGALLGPRLPAQAIRNPRILKALVEPADTIAQINLTNRILRQGLRKEDLPSAARAATGDQPFRGLQGDPQRQFDTVVKKHFRDDMGLNNQQVNNLLESTPPDVRRDLAIEVSRSKIDAIGKVAKAVDEGTPSPATLKETQKVLLDLPAPRTPISDEAGFVQLGRLVDSAPDPQEISKRLIDRAKRLKRKVPVQSLILNGYLSVPRGRFRDFVTTAGNTLAQGATATARARNFYTFHGFGDAVRSSWMASKEAWRTGINKDIREVIASGQLPARVVQQLEEAGRITPELAKTLRAGKADLPEELLEGVVMLRQGKGFRDILARIPFTAGRFNAAQDDFFTSMAFNFQSRLMASQKTARGGAKGAEFGRQFSRNLENLTDTELSQAWETARRVSFREQNLGAVANFFNEAGRLARRKIPFFGPYILAPFVRTPAVIAERTFQYNPAAALVGLGQVLFSKLTTGRASTAGKVNIQRGIVGITGILAFAEAAKQGVITGEGLDLTQKEKDSLIRAGRWAPSSIKVGDTFIDYRGFGPVTALLSLSADIVEKSRAGIFDFSPEGIKNFAIQYPLDTLEAAMEATFLPGIHKTFDAIMKSEQKGRRLADQLFRILQPIGLLSGVAEALDPRRKVGGGIEEIVGARIPGERERVPELGRQTFGESPEVPEGFGGRLILPRRITKSQDPLINFLADRGVLPGRPRVTSFRDKAERQKFRFTEKEKNTIQLAKGRAQRREVERTLRRNPLLNRLSPEQQKKILERALTRANSRIDKVVKDRKRRGLPLDFRTLLIQTG